MEYPEELLPQHNYKVIETKDLNPEHSILRKSLRSKTESLDNLGDVRIDAIFEKEKEVFGLSINLFGIFTCEYLKIIVINTKFHEDWNPGDKIPIIDEIEFTIDENAFPLFFKIKDLHNKSIPYKKNLPKIKGIKNFEGFCCIDHKPTKCNFWHFELSVYDSDLKQTYINASKKTWQKEIAHFLSKSILKMHVSIDVPEKIKISKSCYIM